MNKYGCKGCINEKPIINSFCEGCCRYFIDARGNKDKYKGRGHKKYKTLCVIELEKYLSIVKEEK